MDMNGHVNNVTYLAWALETVPRDVYDGCHLYQVGSQAPLGVLRDALQELLHAAGPRGCQRLPLLPVLASMNGHSSFDPHRPPISSTHRWRSTSRPSARVGTSWSRWQQAAVRGRAA